MSTNDAPDQELEELEAETIADLDVDDDAEDVRGGTMHCPTF